MMKKILFILIFMLPVMVMGQKITKLTSTNSAASTNLIITAETGEDTLKAVTKGHFLSDYVAVADTAGMLNPYINRSDTAAMLVPYINRSDTASMLLKYLLKTDTATMLTPYINKADTASMLTPYINRSDTSNMLDKYIRAAEVAASYQTTLTNSEGLRGALSDETGLGNAVFSASPTLTGTLTLDSASLSSGLNIANGHYIGIDDAEIDETELEILDGATLTTTQINYLNAATGTTGTGNVVFSASPTFTGTVTTALLNINGGGDIDSIQITDSDVAYLFQNGDTIPWCNPASAETDIEDEAIMLTDSLLFYQFKAGNNFATDTSYFDDGGFYGRRKVYVNSFKLFT